MCECRFYRMLSMPAKVSSYLPLRLVLIYSEISIYQSWVKHDITSLITTTNTLRCQLYSFSDSSHSSVQKQSKFGNQYLSGMRTSHYRTVHHGLFNIHPRMVHHCGLCSSKNGSS